MFVTCYHDMECAAVPAVRIPFLVNHIENLVIRCLSVRDICDSRSRRWSVTGVALGRDGQLCYEGLMAATLQIRTCKPYTAGFVVPCPQIEPCSYSYSVDLLGKMPRLSTILRLLLSMFQLSSLVIPPLLQPSWSLITLGLFSPGETNTSAFFSERMGCSTVDNVHKKSSHVVQLRTSYGG